MLYTAIKLKYMYYPGMCNMSTKTFLLVKSKCSDFILQKIWWSSFLMCYFRTADEEDELLYGETESNVFNSSFNMGQTAEMER